MKKNEVREEPEVTMEEVSDELAKVQEYNDNIQNHLPEYLSFQPTQKVLVRVYRRLPIVTKGGFVMDIPSQSDWAKVMKQAGSGQEYAVNEAPTEFRFTKEAVIVALPSYLLSTTQPSPYKVGQKVSIEQLMTKATKQQDGTVYYDYMGSWTHPNSNKVLTPSDCQDPHYGYALIPVNLIEGILE